MADIKNFSLAGVARSVQLGKQGNKLISEGEVLSFRNAAGVDLARVNVAEPTEDTNAVTKKYVDDVTVALDSALDNLNSTRISNSKEDYNAFVGTAEAEFAGKVVVGAEKADGVVGEVAVFESGEEANSHFVFSNSTPDTVTFTADGDASDIDLRLSPKGAGKVEIGNPGESVVVQAEEGQTLTLAGGDALLEGEAVDGNGGDLVLRPGAGAGSGTNGVLAIQAGTGEDLIKFVGEAGNTSHMQVSTGTDSVGIEAIGTEADVSISIAPKGEGKVDVNGAVISNVALPADAADAANKAYVDSKVTSGTAGGILTRVASFEQTGGDIGLAITGVVRRISVEITEAYSAGAELTVGVTASPDLYVSASEIDESAVGSFEISAAGAVALIDEVIKLSISGTPTAGKVKITVEYANA